MLLRCRRHGFRCWGAVWAVSLAAVVFTVAGAIGAGGPRAEGRGGARPLASTSQDPPTDQSSSRRLREGTELVDQVGHFEIVRDRLVYVAERGGVRLLGLENLNLERVARTVAGFPGQLEWKICGTVTEYRGTNYLLLHRAVVTTAAHGQGQ